MTLLALRRHLEKIYRSGSENCTGGDNAENEISYLLCSYFDKSFTWLAVNPGLEISDDDKERLVSAVGRVNSGEPVQYVIGRAPFLGRTFFINNNVLIPRLDTECLYDEARARIKSLLSERKNCCIEPAARGTGGEDRREQLRVLDLCTGSGILAISLKIEFPEADVTATDISAKALEVARRNALKYSCEIGFVESDLFGAIPLGRQFDIIVCNPPYISEEEFETVPHNVKDFEPLIALKGGLDGNDFYRKITAAAGDYLKPGGWLCYEIGESQGDAVSWIMSENRFIDVTVTKDIAELDRVVCGRMAE